MKLVLKLSTLCNYVHVLLQGGAGSSSTDEDVPLSVAYLENLDS